MRRTSEIQSAASCLSADLLAAFGVPHRRVQVPSVVSASASQWQPDGRRTPAKPVRLGSRTLVPLLLLLLSLLNGSLDRHQAE